MAKKTYAQTHKDFQEGLEKHGWKVQRANKSTGKALSVPHATSPDGQHKLWFKTQSVHLSGGGQTMGEARTLTYSDLRDLNFDDFHKVVQSRTGAGKKLGDVGPPGPPEQKPGEYKQAAGGPGPSNAVLAKARELGAKASKEGKPLAPAMNPEVMGLIEGQKVGGQSAEIFKAYQKAHTAETLKEPEEGKKEEKGEGKVPAGEVQTDKGGTISKADAAAKMFGEGSKQHREAIAKFGGAKVPEPSKEGLAKFQQAKEMKATDLNKSSLFEHMQGSDRASNQVPPTSAPHIRRAMKAGLVKVEGKELVLTEEGKKEQAAHEAKRAPEKLERAKSEIDYAQNILNIAKKDNHPQRIAEAEKLLAKKHEDLKRAEERHARLGGKKEGGEGAKAPEAHSLETGSRGGRYYIGANGEKVYVK